MPTGFPDADSLCERCGYPLVGLAMAGVCPECGLPVGESDPVHRTGLPWQNGASVRAWWRTMLGMLTSPSRSFRRMRLGGSRATDRLFMATFVVLVGVLWAIMWRVAGDRWWWAWGLGGAAGMVALTYIEVLGVTNFSRQKQWRVPWSLAERVACYSAGAWFPAALIMGQSFLLLQRGVVWEWITLRLGLFEPVRDLFYVVGIASLAMLWFEMLVWLGIRKVRFANQLKADDASVLTRR